MTKFIELPWTGERLVTSISGGDIVLEHLHRYAFALELVAGKERGTPKHIVTMHGMYELDLGSTAECLPLLMKQVDRWVYISPKNLEPFKETGFFSSHKFTHIGLGMKKPIINPLDRSALQIKEDAFVVCVASRAIPEKGWAESIAAVNLSREKTGKDIHLLLIGNGPIYDSLSSQRLPPHVHLLGFQLNPVDYYAMADLGLLASTYKAESFPMSIVECLMAGRPVVASDLGEIRNMLTLSNARMAGSVFSMVDGKIPVETVSSLINAHILNQDMYAAAAANAHEAAKKLDMAHVVDEHVKLYREVLRAK